MKILHSPLFCQWDITRNCNLNCKICRNSGTTGRHSKNWELICKRIIESGVMECSLSGGEPLTHPNFKNIVEYLSCSLKQLNILTNGTLIEKEMAKFFFIHNCLLHVSIDGGCEKSHDKIRGNGNFSKTISGIENLRKFGVKFITQLTITPLNYGEVPGFVELSKLLGATSANIRRCIPIGSGRSISILSAESLKKIYKTAFESGKKYEIKISVGDYFAALSFSPEIETSTRYAVSKSKNTILGGCPIGWTAFYVRWDGVVMFCPYLPIKCGNILKQNFREIWYKSKMYLISRNLRWNLVGKCSKCIYLMACAGCPAATYHTTGNILNSDPQCWI